MGAGIRPNGSFSYAALRYKEERPVCFNNRSKVPSRYLCGACVHVSECRDRVPIIWNSAGLGQFCEIMIHNEEDHAKRQRRGAEILSHGPFPRRRS